MKPVFEAMDRRLDPAPPAPIVVALSGGGDSLALLHLTMDWARPRGRRVLALTIDHGLHPDSARWTAEAGAKVQALGADWRALRWQGEKPETSIEARARAARHTLLAEAAREVGARVALVGHNADDVAEGELMRETDAPGLGQLREWAPSPIWPEGRGVFLLRPLLGIGRAELRSYLMDRSETWLDDPANEDPSFARVRARHALHSAHPRGSGDPGLGGSTSGSSWVPASAGMSGGEVGALARAVSFAPGFAAAPIAPFLTADALAVRWALTALVMCVGGATTPPRGDELERLVETMAAGGTCTLSGCRIEARGPVLAVHREAGRQGQPPRPEEPAPWVAQRFYAACGLYQDEASIPPPS